MNVATVMKKMIEISEGNLHDINHFIKVHSYARTIGLLEGVSPELLETIEVAATVHDIACPLCRRKYGNTNGKYQEIEGGPLARELLESLNAPKALADRVVFLVEHHHTLKNVDGIDWQILLEADYLVNADESQIAKTAIVSVRDHLFRTQTGIELLNGIYCL